MYKKLPRYYFLVVIFLAVIFTAGCEKIMEKFYTITLINNSPKQVVGYLARNIQYPDTILPLERPTLKVLSKGDKLYIDSRTEWTKILDEIPSKTISLFIVDANTYRDSSWTIIRSKHLVLKRYDIIAKDFKNGYLDVTYP